MKKSCALVLLILASPIVPGLGNEQEPVAISRLGSSRAADRDAAMLEIWKQGTKAIPALRLALKGSHPEIANRAALVLRRIELALTPESDPHTVDLVDHYQQFDATKRTKLLTQLQDLGYTTALLKLWAEENDLRVRDQTEKLAAEALSDAVTKALARQAHDEALDFIRLLPNHPNSALWTAGLAHALGRLPDEIARLEESTHPRERKILLACYRRAGQLDQALKLAEDLKDQEAHAALALLAGDVTPFQEWIAPQLTSPAQQAALDILKAQWEGDDSAAREQAESLLARTQNPEQNRSRAEIHAALNLCGYFDLSRESMARHGDYRLSTLSYYRHDTQRILGDSGYPQDLKARQNWLKEKINVIRANKDFNGDDAQALKYVAGDLYSFGDETEAKGIIDTLHQAAQQAGPDQVEDFLENLGTVFRWVILDQVDRTEWEEDDYDKAIADLTRRTYNDEKAKSFWKALKATDWPVEKRFQVYRNITQGEPEKTQERQEACQQIFSLAKEHPELLEDMLDLTSFWLPLSMLEPLIKAEAQRFPDLDETRQKRVIKYHMIQRDWQSAARDLGLMNNRSVIPAAYRAAIFHHTGNTTESQKELVIAVQNHLITPDRLSQLALEFNFAGLYQHAEDIEKRMLQELSISSKPWSNLLKSAWEKAIHAGDLKKAQAFGRAIMLNQLLFLRNLEPLEPFEAFLRDATSRSLVLASQGESERAQKLLKRAVMPVTGSFLIAEVFLEHVDHSKFPALCEQVFQVNEEYSKEVIARHPNFRRALNGLAWNFAVSHRKLSEAERYSVRSITNWPDGAFYDTLARIHTEQGNAATALELQRHAISWYPFERFDGGSGILKTYDDLVARANRD